MFFFSKNIVWSLSVSAFIVKTSNLIMNSAMFCFPCLNVSIFHLASAAFVLSLNIVLIFFMKSSQSWVLSSLSNSLSFCCVYMSTTFPLRWARIAVILLSVSMTLLFLRNNYIPFHQSSNFVQSLSNHPRSGTMLFGIIAYIFLFLFTSASDISLSICSVILLRLHLWSSRILISWIMSQCYLFNMNSLCLLVDYAICVLFFVQ